MRTKPAADSMKRLISFSLDVCIRRAKATTHRKLEENRSSNIPGVFLHFQNILMAQYFHSLYLQQQRDQGFSVRDLFLSDFFYLAKEEGATDRQKTFRKLVLTTKRLSIVQLDKC